MNIREEALKIHSQLEGKISVESKMKLNSKEDLSLAYTPGVAEPCREIEKDKSKVYEYTMKGNTVAVVTNGTAVLGLGNIGPEASLPVMEGKAILFKEFGGINAFPVCIDSEDPEKIIETVKLLAPTFGGINLEDIKAPECFYIEERLKEELDIPVFHDDQHGTAIVCLAGIYNAIDIVGKKSEDVKVVINGAGAAGTAICKLLLKAGFKNIVMCDINGALERNDGTLSDAHKALANITNEECMKGTLGEIIEGRDIFIGVSAANVLKPDMVKKMNKDAIIFAMANPNPEIMPNDAKEAGARIVATGRSDFPNQINNVLVFPGIFKGALKARAKGITEEMKLAAARGLADMVPRDQMNEEYIIPNALNKEVADSIANAVMDNIK